MAEQRYCGRCRKTMADTNFYTYKDGTKCELCKPCLTAKIDNFDDSTFIWLLEKFDVPYIPAEWNTLRDKAFAKDPYKMNGMSVFGKYLSKMKLKQWKMYSWADTEELQKKAEVNAETKSTLTPEEMEAKLAEMKVLYDEGKISVAEYETYQEITKADAELAAAKAAFENHQPMPQFNQPPNGQSSFYPVNDNPFEQVELPDVRNDLTEDDKIHLALKWGRLYSAEDWVALEATYRQYENSFDIHNADLEKGLIQLCKLDLKLNQAIDAGDIDSYSKMSRSYDSLRKSLKFTEAQNKEEKAGDFDSVGAIVNFAERAKGSIPPWKIDAPQDIIDTILEDNRRYIQTLWENDTHLAQQIEDFMEQIRIQRQQKEDREKAKEQGLDTVILSDEDYEEYYDKLEELKEQDKLIFIVGDEEEDEE